MVKLCTDRRMFNEADILKLEKEGGGKERGMCPFGTMDTGVGTYWLFHCCFGKGCAVWNEKFECCGLLRGF